MKREFSIYLDLLRSTAAITVFLGHVSWGRVSGGFLWQLQPLGHDAVVVFFVLSGFVIQHVVTTRETTFWDYERARIARLYSVVIPALVLTLVCDAVGTHSNAHVYDMLRQSHPFFRLIVSGLFLSQSWSWNLDTLSNEPFWSLPYEFWYYQLFAGLIFFSGHTRVALVGAAALFCGPNILIFFPVWLFGVLACRASATRFVSPRAALLIWTVSVLCLVAVLLVDLVWSIPRSNHEFLPAFFSPLDFVTGALVALNIFAASYLRLPLGLIAKPIRALAGSSFALYLFHMPLLHLAAAFAPTDWPVPIKGLVIGAFAFTEAIALSYLTERRKNHWRALAQGLSRWAAGALAGTGTK